MDDYKYEKDLDSDTIYGTNSKMLKTLSTIVANFIYIRD